jgi:hypothetical protein
MIFIRRAPGDVASPSSQRKSLRASRVGAMRMLMVADCNPNGLQGTPQQACPAGKQEPRRTTGSASPEVRPVATTMRAEAAWNNAVSNFYWWANGASSETRKFVPRRFQIMEYQQRSAPQIQVGGAGLPAVRDPKGQCKIAPRLSRNQKTFKAPAGFPLAAKPVSVRTDQQTP